MILAYVFSVSYLVNLLLKVQMKKILASVAFLIAAISSAAHATPVLQNADFADNNVTPGGYNYSSSWGGDVSAPGWTFSGLSGISANSGAWGAVAPAGGSAYAFLQTGFNDPSYNGNFSQTFNSTGTNNLTFSFNLAERINCCGDIGAQVVGVFFDGVQLNAFQPDASGAWSLYSVMINNVAAGSHTVSFAGLTTSPDTAAFVADVQLMSTAVPEPSVLALLGLAMFAFGAARRTSGNNNA